MARQWFFDTIKTIATLWAVDTASQCGLARLGIGIYSISPPVVICSLDSCSSECTHIDQISIPVLTLINIINSKNSTFIIKNSYFLKFIYN